MPGRGSSGIALQFVYVCFLGAFTALNIYVYMKLNLPCIIHSVRSTTIRCLLRRSRLLQFHLDDLWQAGPRSTASLRACHAAGTGCHSCILLAGLDGVVDVCLHQSVTRSNLRLIFLDVFTHHFVSATFTSRPHKCSLMCNSKIYLCRRCNI